ncbi:enoyl-CoA hydratase-related protein [Streptomyces sp. F-1]|uniref:enoyl-CoA hydratase-related protein n=1 Tax=Streptomyces sp. F-1 TaxID=463642 RepID=UPI0008FFA86C|nr:enoyl-CoA hydratase-related protein [Streptomyces sp. F-1]
MSSLSIDRVDGVAVPTLRRPAERNALDDATVLGLEEFFRKPGADVRAVVLDAEGDHFSAGLDLGELTERRTEEALEHSLMWHRVFDTIEGGHVPVVAAHKGAVIGGGPDPPADRRAPHGGHDAHRPRPRRRRGTDRRPLAVPDRGGRGARQGRGTRGAERGQRAADQLRRPPGPPRIAGASPAGGLLLAQR